MATRWRSQRKRSGIRRPGAGRKQVTDTDPTLLRDLESLIDPVTRGDPESPLRWTTKSVRNLAAELCAMGHQVGKQKVSELLHELDYSLQSLRKTSEGSPHPDRNAQFEHINRQAKAFQAKGPARHLGGYEEKEELIGDFSQQGERSGSVRESPSRCAYTTSSIPSSARPSPYGVYDVARNEGWVNVGIDHDTAEFAVESIRRWWYRMGRYAYPEATELLPHGRRRRQQWLPHPTLETQATEVRGRFGTAADHRALPTWHQQVEQDRAPHVFSYHRELARPPLENLETVVNLIANTTTSKGLRIKAALDSRRYADKIKVSDDDFATVNIKPNTFHGDWNYAIRPLLSTSVQ